MSRAEQPDYKVIKSKESIEIREYAPMIVAEVEVSGERKQAIKEGFKILADYIFGNKVAMTAPVMQKLDGDKWKVRFIMPKKYSLEALPKPNSKDVVLISVPQRNMATIRFSGFANDANIKQHTQELEAYILAEKITPCGETLLAFYNPPWTLPFLRRNEVMIEIEGNR